MSWYSSIKFTESPVIVHENLQCESHKPYGPLTSIIAAAT
jgi:hypothetical protein